jgi:hypothetical protein
MVGASFDGELNADHLQVGNSLLMRSEGRNKANFKAVVLRGAKSPDRSPWSAPVSTAS